MRIRCPHCQQRMELLEDDPLVEVDCPSCGSSFSLISVFGETTEAVTTRKIGHFELLNELGRGAFGSVWKAHDSELDRFVAIKLPRKERLDEHETEKFLREARAAAQLRHPNVVPVHEVGRDSSGQLYIVSDLIHGATLSHWLRSKPLNHIELVELMITLCDAVQHAHNRGVIHRDLKPQNILIDANGVPHITDFGLAKREVGEITMTVEGKILGTPAYMSPEQAEGKSHSVDCRCDIYSLGVILYELLTGELPFRGSQQMLLLQILNDEPPAPRRLNSHIHRDIETICLKCLEKDPRRRYTNVNELGAELKRYRRGEPILARPIGSVQKTWRWCRRNPVAAVALTAVTALLIVSTGAAIWINSARDETWRQMQEVQRQQGLVREQRNQAFRFAGEANRLRRRSEWILYALLIGKAYREWESGQVDLARTTLDICQWDLRGWEHDFLYSQIQGVKGLALSAHSAPISCVAFSPGGKRIISAGKDRAITVWDAEDGSELLKLVGHGDEVTCVTFSPNGQRIVSGSRDGTLKIWNAENGQTMSTLEGHQGGVCSIAFNSDGTRILSGGGDAMIKVWNVATTELIGTFQGHERSVKAVLCDKDNRRIISGGSDNTLKMWDLATGHELLTIRAHESSITGLALSKDGKRIVSSSQDHTLKVWNALDGRQLLTLRGHTSPVACVAIHPDGSRIVSGGDKQLKVWDAESGQEVLNINKASRLASIAFSPDGRRIITGSDDATLSLWNAGLTVDMFPLQKPLLCAQSVAFSPSGKRIVCGSFDTSLTEWDVTTGQEIRTLHGHDGPVRGVAISPDGTQMVSASDRMLKVWNMHTGRELSSLKSPTRINCVVYVTNNGRIVCGGEGGLSLWDLESQRQVFVLGKHSRAVASIDYCPLTQQLVSGSGDGTVKTWNLQLGQNDHTFSGHDGAVECVAFSPNGRWIVSGSQDGTIRVWNAIEGNERLTIQGHSGTVHGVAFSPNGEIIASGSADHMVLLWDAETGQAISTLRGHAGPVTLVAFTTDGTKVVSGAHDRTLRFWTIKPPSISDEVDPLVWP